MANHIKFRKEGDYTYVTTKNNVVIGIINYYEEWKCYVFEPDANTIYSADCLNAIQKTIEAKNAGKVKP